MDLLIIILFGLLAYIVGSIPTSVWFGQHYFKIDLREHGSGNPGATNTFRVLGKRAGTIVLLGDVLKGAIATTLAIVLFRLDLIYAEELIRFRLLFGVLAVIGHIFPVFLSFRGGKGVATLSGMTLAVAPEGAIISIIVFLMVVFVSKYVSLGSMIGTLTFPLILITLPALKPDDPILITYGFVLTAIIIWTHRKNVGRLLRGEENKTYLIPRNQENE